MLHYSFDKAQSPFFSVLKKRVSNYFSDNNLQPAGNHKLWLKAFVLLFTAIGFYVILVFVTPPTWLAILLCVTLGLNLALIGFNVMHDGGHQSFSKHRWVNTAAAYMLNALGGSAYYWQVKHNINHHTYTNIEGMDSDIDVKPFMRLHEDQPLRPYHRFQHIYWIILYGISYLAWVFYEDFQKYFSGRISVNSPKKKLSLAQHFIFWGTKTAYIFIYILLPIYIIGWLPWLIGFLIITVVCGVIISLVFQLAHVVGSTQFYSTDRTGPKDDWAVHQVRSTADFATQNKFLHWMLGGLNFQIEHHLFPRISHIHYPAVARYVKQTCREFGIARNEYKTMFSAVISHLKHLYHLGRTARPA
jgi:linoleoyl-CoA desaturase